MKKLILLMSLLLSSCASTKPEHLFEVAYKDTGKVYFYYDIYVCGIYPYGVYVFQWGENAEDAARNLQSSITVGATGIGQLKFKKYNIICDYFDETYYRKHYGEDERRYD